MSGPRKGGHGAASGATLLAPRGSWRRSSAPRDHRPMRWSEPRMTAWTTRSGRCPGPRTRRSGAASTPAWIARAFAQRAASSMASMPAARRVSSGLPTTRTSRTRGPANLPTRWSSTSARSVLGVCCRTPGAPMRCQRRPPSRRRLHCCRMTAWKTTRGGGSGLQARSSGAASGIAAVARSRVPHLSLRTMNTARRVQKRSSRRQRSSRRRRRKLQPRLQRPPRRWPPLPPRSPPTARRVQKRSSRRQRIGSRRGRQNLQPRHQCPPQRWPPLPLRSPSTATTATSTGRNRGLRTRRSGAASTGGERAPTPRRSTADGPRAPGGEGWG
mmetsp:Transcript_17732/g.45698  ORF Transcript_17732/g.45698 Transcript_17732/m.45698 type:complete len:328 (+) Transcript_17732:171-1154(+)